MLTFGGNWTYKILPAKKKLENKMTAISRTLFFFISIAVLSSAVFSDFSALECGRSESE